VREPGSHIVQTGRFGRPRWAAYRGMAAFAVSCDQATSLIDPSGRCQAYLSYGHEGVLAETIRVEEATGLLATRHAPERYQDVEGE
jgi:hypothetical protein